jgi:hypothetical protein
LAAASWEAADGRLPPEISKCFDASGIEAIASLRLLVAMPDWEFDLGMERLPPVREMLVVARNAQGLCVIAVEPNAEGALECQPDLTPDHGVLSDMARMQGMIGLRSFDPRVHYRLLYRACCALQAAEEFEAKAAVLLVHSFETAPLARLDFERFCATINANSAGDCVFVAPARARPSLYLAWCDADPVFSGRLWDPAQLALPAF